MSNLSSRRYKTYRTSIGMRFLFQSMMCYKTCCMHVPSSSSPNGDSCDKPWFWEIKTKDEKCWHQESSSHLKATTAQTTRTTRMMSKARTVSTTNTVESSSLSWSSLLACCLVIILGNLAEYVHIIKLWSIDQPVSISCFIMFAHYINLSWLVG